MTKTGSLPRRLPLPKGSEVFFGSRLRRYSVSFWLATGSTLPGYGGARTRPAKMRGRSLRETTPEAFEEAAVSLASPTSILNSLSLYVSERQRNLRSVGRGVACRQARPVSSVCILWIDNATNITSDLYS